MNNYKNPKKLIYKKTISKIKKLILQKLLKKNLTSLKKILQKSIWTI